MKQKLILLFLSLSLLTGCTKVRDTISQETTGDTLATNSFDNTFYDTIITSGTEAREPVYLDFSRNLSDYYMIGRGLQVLSLDYFSNKNHSLREGTHFTKNDYAALLGYGDDSIQFDKGSSVDGISDPVLATSLVQQEYVVKEGTGYKLAGMSLALAVASDQTDSSGITHEFNQSTIESFSKDAVKKVYNYFISQYKELSSIPILIGVYQMSKSTDETSGKFIYYCYNDGKEGDLKSTNMQTVVFSSDEAKSLDNSLSSEFTIFKEKVKSTAVDAVSMVGYGSYLNNKIMNFKIEVYLNTKTYTETTALMNYMAGEVDTCFNSDLELKIIVYSHSDLQGFIIKKSGESTQSYTIN